MPYNPVVFDVGGKSRIAAAQSIADAIRDERKKREQTEKEIAFSDRVMKAARDDERISDEDYNSYLQKPANAKHSTAMGQMANMEDDFKREQLAQRLLQSQTKQEGWSPNPETLQRFNERGFDYAPNSPRSGQWVNTKGKDPAAERIAKDPWRALDADVKHATGEDLGDWRSALKPRFVDETGKKSDTGQYFEADFPDKQILNPGTGKMEMIKGTTRRIPRSTYDQFKSRAAKLDNPAGGLSEQQLDGITGQTPLPGAQTTPGGPVRVNSPAEAQALPSGTLFITPDGRLKRRP